MTAQLHDEFDFGRFLESLLPENILPPGSEFTEGQKVFTRAVRRELAKYSDPQRSSYPRTQFEQVESFARTVGDLYNSYFDGGHRKISDCLYNRWRALAEASRSLAASGAANKPAWVAPPQAPAPSDEPVFFDA